MDGGRSSRGSAADPRVVVTTSPSARKRAYSNRAPRPTAPGSPDDPRALLQPILAAIESGETPRDVRDARALLAELV
jgi:hypothetical protein